MRLKRILAEVRVVAKKESGDYRRGKEREDMVEQEL
jgi:hypothetical protein